MKRIITMISLIFLVSSSISFAQIKLGVGAGLNFANASITPSTVSTTTRTGFMVGGVFEIALSSSISLQPELIYIQKGCAASQGNTSVTEKFSYIEIPVLLKVKFGTSEFKPYVFGGPAIALNMSAEEELNNGTQTQTNDLKNVIESTDFGLQFGAGADYSINPKTILFGDIRYALGLSNIAKTAGVSIKTTGIQIFVGIKFALN